MLLKIQKILTSTVTGLEALSIPTGEFEYGEVIDFVRAKVAAGGELGAK